MTMPATPSAIPLNRSPARRARSSADERLLYGACVLVPVAALLLFFLFPLATIVWRSLVEEAGGVGPGNYLALFRTPGILRAVTNSLAVGLATTAVCLVLGFMVAYAVQRTRMPGKRFVSAALSLPLLAPSLVLGLGLIFLLGRNGLVSNLLGTRINIYGFSGLLIANVLYALPQAVLIIQAALRHSDARYYDAAEVMGATRWQQFTGITLPNVKFGLLSAGFVVFTVTITDFGNAVTIGGDFTVLATEIYNQVTGQMKFGIGAAVGILLLLPTGVAVYIERVAAQRQFGTGSESALPPVPDHVPARDVPLFLATMALALSIVAVVATVVFASFVRLWPYRLDLTTKHYAITLSGGYEPLWTSLGVSVAAAGIGTALLFALAFGLRRLPAAVAKTVYLLAVLPVGVPGLVLGLSYIFAFNLAGSPLHVLYGSALLLALCNFYHYHTQGFLTMVTGMRAVPPALEEAATCLGGGAVRVLGDVVVPVMVPTLLSVFFFLFMRSMVTLSAVIFLVTPSVTLGAVSVMRLDEAGFVSQAAAFSTCIMAVVAAAALAMRGAVTLATRRTVS
ncbi:ABC transporter permease subunit [Azospirillum picis]|uniref:Iron(III) transport system permease protein n=1 Tax=Azospirillum picis TaxID=488438 RepID=A0ABU0MNL9_9PROT|nr:ABC transporter permease subunit [Azospirillum picis]MBP2301773.1 iron(III) transport system permease protein [Azospirillum picis]MDQ0535052.1 iron(III) transport system permease protein [Azospirillum picis]